MCNCVCRLRLTHCSYEDMLETVDIAVTYCHELVSTLASDGRVAPRTSSRVDTDLSEACARWEKSNGEVVDYRRWR